MSENSHKLGRPGAKRVFSGVQPTGSLHLGNYLGAIRNFVELQNEYECVYCIVDQHAITVWQDPKELAAHTRRVAAAYLAAGIDAAKSIVFNQSAVSAHTELAWVFNCVARVGWLNRMTQFKDKAGKDKENVSVGLFVYPCLMAADILVYKATHVPVGEDQKQHLELSRDIAQKFNNDFSVPGFFPLPQPLILGAAARVMNLRDGNVKMSKSDKSDYSRINMDDDADAIVKKIRKARTDPHPLPSVEAGLEGRPEADNLVGIFAALSGETKADVLARFGGAQFSVFKSELADLAVSLLAPVGKEMTRLLGDPGAIDEILRKGASRAEAIAEPILDEVKSVVGFLR